MRTLNLGILAHVDAGKTSLTERLLYAAGVIDEIGRVDDGSTQTDSLELERQRCITIKSAVVSFVVDDVIVNLIDTPGHPDFIAEVERVLCVLDEAVLVLSAVEGVQAQTRVLMRTLQRLRIPTLLFVNKIDRGGARDAHLLLDIAEKLTPAIVAMGATRDIGSRDASFVPYREADAAFIADLADKLVEHDDALLTSYVSDPKSVSYRQLCESLAAQARRSLVHPVFFGSAITGAGVDALIAGITELLPATVGAVDGPVSGTVFKVERGPAGEKVAYVRMFSGEVRTRDRLRFGAGVERKVTAIAVYEQASAVPRGSVGAGRIGKLWGLGDVRIGDAIGDVSAAAERHSFAPPTLETVCVPRRADEKGRLRVALGQLEEQDPLINLRQDDTGVGSTEPAKSGGAGLAGAGAGKRAEISLSLYGEVQREVIEATLAGEYGLEVRFRETTTICIERPKASGEAVEILNTPTNPFHADLGLRVEPAPPGSGVEVVADPRLDPRDAPLYAFKTFDAFVEHMGDYVRLALEEGLCGWQVSDCVVTVTKIAYSLADGPPSRRGPMPTARDVKRLVPLVLMQALEQGGTEVCEPVFRIAAEVPTEAIGSVLAALGRLGAGDATPSARGELSVLEASLPTSRVQELRRQLPGLTGGEGVLDSEFAGYQPVTGEAPIRRRLTPDPRNLEEYLAQVGR